MSRTPCSVRHGRAHAAMPAQRQQGVVLAVALILLVVISLLAAMQIRTATSSEGVANNVRLNQLATQAAEAALRFCEAKLASQKGGVAPAAGDPAIYAYSSVPAWASLTGTWDAVGVATPPYVLTTATVNLNVSATFKRPPECLIQSLDPAPAATKSFVVTARGFGPEVPAADASRTAPVGTEVWLQSTLEF